MRFFESPLYRATCSSVYAADGKTPTGNFIHEELAPYTYDGAPPCPFITRIAVAPPTSVTWLPAPERSIHWSPLLLELLQESAV
jgi:hypothetical protein